MYNTHQLGDPPSFTYLSHHNPDPSPNPNSNRYLSHHQQMLHYAEPVIHPPGTDLYANSGVYPLTHVGFDGQTQHYVDPNAASASWVTGQAAPITYELGSSSTSNSYWTNQPLVNDVTRGILNQSKVIQSFRCEVCNISCNSKDVFDTHLSGKKHLRNMQNHLSSSTAASLQKSYNAVNNRSLSSQIGNNAVDSAIICPVCNITCNGQDMFNKHLYGKKHAAQVALTSLGGVGKYFAEIKAQNNNFWNKSIKKPKVVQSAWCEVCKINCTSNDVYVKHLQGKKHQKNLETIEKTKNGISASGSIAAPSSSNPTIGPVEKPEANKSKNFDPQKKRAALVEDLETKIRKVVKEGAAADAVQVCTICNVVCNSQKVFSFHLAGEKHATMVKKQAEA